jgi:hypothetical protein
VQVEPIHEDVIPPVVHLLRMHGAEPTIYLNEKIRTDRPGFKRRYPDLAPMTRFVPLDWRPEWHALARRITKSAPDLVLINTFQFGASGGWAGFWDGPMLGLVHNPRALQRAEPSMDLVRSGRIGLLTLAPHVTAYLMAADPTLYATVATVTMAFPFSPRLPPVQTPGRTRISVPGRVDFTARDYEQVVGALPKVLDEVDAGGFEVCIVGGGPDRDDLQRLVRAEGLEELFHFVPLNDQGFVSGDAYFSHVRSSTFLLPALPLDADPYRIAKITASIPNAVGLGVPPILDRWTAAVYGVPAVTYPGAAIADGLVRALTMTGAELDTLRADLRAHRRLELHRASAEMAFALRNVGIPIES